MSVIVVCMMSTITVISIIAMGSIVVSASPTMVLLVILVQMLRWPDWSVQKYECISEVMSCVKVAASLPVRVHLGNVVLNVNSVLEVVHTDCLHESEWVIEDGRPIFNCMDISLHASAVFESIWKLKN